MRTRMLLAAALASVAFSTNVTTAGNIVHGVKVVVIDAGHGGNDPGAHYAGVSEKDIVLKVALKLGKLIEEEMPGVQVVYTRKTDKALGADKLRDLQARADIANRAGGDLFLSIHANATPRASGVKGVETLIMGETPKEQRYNENALYENNRDDLIDMSDERTAAIVRAYIQNLQFTYGEYSMALARCIQNRYLKAGRHSRGIKPQLLRVLFATDMPGVLTEIGFMSNAQELAYLKSEKGQAEIARTLLTAVKDYSAWVLGARQADADAQADAPKATAESSEAGEAKGSAGGSTNAAAKRPDAKGGTKPAGGKNEGAAGGENAVATPAAGTKAGAKGGDKTKENSTAAQGTTAASAGSGKVCYAVQVLAATKAVPLTSSEFKSYRGKVKQYTAEGTFRYKYCVGEYDDRAEAQRQAVQVRKVFPEAFVVRCRDRRIVKE